MENAKLKAFENNMKGKRVAIVGLGVSNTPLIDYFHNLMAKVTVFDERDLEQLDENIVKKINEYGFDLVTGKKCITFFKRI